MKIQSTIFENYRARGHRGRCKYNKFNEKSNKKSEKKNNRNIFA